MPTLADLAEDWEQGRELGFVRPPVDYVTADELESERRDYEAKRVNSKVRGGVRKGTG